MNAALEVHADDPGFGYRFIADELTDAGHDLSERRVGKICSQAGIFSAHSRKRGRFKKPGPPVHEDLVERVFTAPAGNRLWLTDITEHPTAEGKLYLCAVKDVWSRRIIGYSIDSRMTSHLAVNALEMAVARRGPREVRGCVVHADRGSQFRSSPYTPSAENGFSARARSPSRGPRRKQTRRTVTWSDRSMSSTNMGLELASDARASTTSSTARSRTNQGTLSIRYRSPPSWNAHTRSDPTEGHPSSTSNPNTTWLSGLCASVLTG